jgi:hypothetical protein
MKSRAFRAEKEFGLIVGGVFVLLGLWWLYRGKFTMAAYVLSAAGSSLVLCGLVFPRLLTVPRRFWMKLAEGMAYISSRIILAIIFFLVLTPIGLVKRATGWDPLERRSKSRESFWRSYPVRDREHFERMY